MTFEEALEREAQYMRFQFEAERRNDHAEAAAMAKYRRHWLDVALRIVESEGSGS